MVITSMNPAGYLVSVLTLPSILISLCLTIFFTSSAVNAYFSLFRMNTTRGKHSLDLCGPVLGLGAKTPPSLSNIHALGATNRFRCFLRPLSYRVQTEATKIFTDLDKDVLRKMQGDMHRCSANCCENKTASIDDVQRCIESCAGPLTRAQTYMQQEVENFQERLNRCAMDCQDKVRDKLTADISETQKLQLRQEMEACVKKCADEHIRKLPELHKKLKTNISSMK